MVKRAVCVVVWFLTIGMAPEALSNQLHNLLPFGWKSSVDGKGRTYYYNSESKQTTWAFPDRRSLIFDLFPVRAPSLHSNGQ
jgi:hypothetical protein